VLTLALACALAYSRFSFSRLPGVIGRLRSTTHPASLTWATVVIFALLIASVVLLLVWGIRTAVLVKPRVIGVGVLLLIPAFALMAWAFAAWRVSGWASRHSSRSAVDAPKWQLYLRNTHPFPAVVACSIVLFTGYELCVVYNGDTVPVLTGSGLRQSYVHR
jgi:hypothetical protein